MSQEIIREEPTFVPEIPLAQILGMFTDSERIYENHSRSTQDAYITDAKYFVKTLRSNGLADLSSVTQEILDCYLHNASQGSLQTRNRRVASLKHFFSWANHEKLLPEGKSPITLPRYTKTELPIIDHLSYDEEVRLLQETSKDPRIHALILLVLRTGAKISEVVRLKQSSFQKDDQGFYIYYPEFGRQQGRKSRLDIDIARSVQSHIEENLDNLEHDTYLFPSKNHSQLPHLTRIGAWDIINRCSKRAGLRKITPSMLRHTFCHNLNGNTSEISNALGITHYSAQLIHESLKRQSSPQTPQIPLP